MVEGVKFLMANIQNNQIDNNPSVVNPTIPIDSPDYCSQFLQIVKIDSLKIRIPRNDVKIVSTTFLQRFQKVYINDGELDEHISLESHKTNLNNGITARIGIVESLVAKGITEEFIYIQVNAKMCEKRYFEGINKNTIRIVYDYIISLNVIYISFEVFLSALVSDIDFAYDISISPEHMKALNHKIYSSVLPNKKKFLDEPFRRKDNVGIVFNSREKATPSSPFIKIYHKGLEFYNKSKQFCDFYFLGIDLSNYGRLEYTLKNAKHQKYLGLGIKTLNQLLEIDRNLIERIVLDGIKENYMEKWVHVVDYSKLSPTDKVLLYFLNESIDKGSDKTDLYKCLSVFDVKVDKDRKDKSKMRKRIDLLINDLHKEKKLDENKKLSDVIRLLNLDGVI